MVPKERVAPAIQRWTLHDLRRSFASGLLRLGVAPHIVELALNHHSGFQVCPLLDKSGQRCILALDGLSAYDLTATLAVHCGNGFDASFSPYQSACLSRYNAAS
jgi:hypothetical protein